jgi:hypothetical protein
MRPGSESAAQGFEEQVTDDSRNQGNDEVRSGEDLFKSPCQPLGAPQSRALELAHEEVRIEEEDDESDLRQRSQGFSLHIRTLSWMGSDHKAIRHLACQETRACSHYWDGGDGSRFFSVPGVRSEL